MLNKNKTGLVLGILFAICHLLWSLAVLAGVAQKFLTWIFSMHMLNNVFTVTSFNAVNALVLLVVTFITGYVTGWVFALLWNWIAKKK